MNQRPLSITLFSLGSPGEEELRRKLESLGMRVTLLPESQIDNLESNEEQVIYLIAAESNEVFPRFPIVNKPLLLLADDHEKQLRVFEGFFLPLLGLPRNAPLSNIIDALTVLDEMRFSKEAQKKSRKASSTESVSEEPPAVVVAEEPAAALGRYLMSLKKLGPLGGVPYASMHVVNRPQTPNRFVIFDSAITKAIQELGRWQKSHAFRVATIAPLLAAPVIEDKKLLDEILVAALLMTTGIRKDHATLLRKDYTGRGSNMVRKELASLLKDSALQLALLSGAESISSIVAMSARYIGREQPPEDSALGIAASALVAADCIDRIVFFTGFFRPEPAHRIIRGITKGKLKDFHPAISCNLIKFLAESMSAKKFPENPEAKVAELTELEQSVKLHDLIPGMRLSRPLNAIDGKELIDADVELDEDLILRIWQLSTLRPIRPAVVVNL